jgi:WhiB family redox-sensing transcriptional regulator
MDDALCAEIGTDVFFPDHGESRWPAKRICDLCPVKRECGEYAVALNINHGVWGGLTPQDRRRIRKLRGKNDG